MCIIWFMIPSQPSNVMVISIALIIDVVGAMLTWFSFLPAVIVSMCPPALTLVGSLYLQGDKVFLAASTLLFLLTCFGIISSRKLAGMLNYALQMSFELEEQRQIANKERQLAIEASARAEQEAHNAQFERKRSVEIMTAAAQQRERLINLLKLKNEERERFIRAAYHDTMQPLAAIGAQTVVMKLDPGLTTNGPAIEALNEIERSRRDIAEGIRGIYDLFQWGAHEPKLEAVSIHDLLMEIEKRFSEPAKSINLQFRIHPSKVSKLHGNSDYAMLKRVLENLVSNAIKYTEQGGIVIGAVGFRETLRIDIWDTGAGIAPDQHQKIFEEFYQVDEQAPGIGLGLPIVRLLVERLSGHTLSFRSRLGHGSRFSITLPRCEAPTRLDQSPLTATTSAAPLTGAYVIVVENNKNVLNGLRSLFESLGCIVRIAVNLKDLQQLIEAAPDRAPDVVISDYRLRNNETGADVVKLIEQHFDWTIVPVVFYSANLDIPEALLAKPLRYIERKGIAPDSLITKVQEAVLSGRNVRTREIEEKALSS
ncbi:MAG: response regulator [Gammaproteobacteria bacterium]|nr:MAG: response regulator [Gammaproteobacteria bacterium]